MTAQLVCVEEENTIISSFLFIFFSDTGLFSPCRRHLTLYLEGMASELFAKRIRPSFWQCTTQQQPVLHEIVPRLLMRFALKKPTNVRQFSTFLVSWSRMDLLPSPMFECLRMGTCMPEQVRIFSIKIYDQCL